MTYNIKEHAISLVMEVHNVTRQDALDVYNDEIEAAMQFILLTSEFTDNDNHPLKDMKRQ